MIWFIATAAFIMAQWCGNLVDRGEHGDAAAMGILSIATCLIYIAEQLSK